MPLKGFVRCDNRTLFPGKFVHVYDSVIKGGEKRKGRRKGKGERERKDEKEERERRKATIGINNSILVTPQLVAAAAAVAL
jgi:hypothetical protein